MQPTLTTEELNAPSGMTTMDGGVMTGNNVYKETELADADPTPNILSPEPEADSQPTVVSTDSLRNQLADAQSRLDAIKAQTAVVPPPEEIKEETKDVDVSDLLDGEKTELQLAQDEIDSFAKTSQKQIDDRKKEFDRYYSRSSNLLKSQIRSIQKTFDVRRNQAEEVAENAKAASLIMGSRTGRMRYAPEIQRGIITGQENALITTLSEIDAMELAAIAAAEEAAFDRDYDTFIDEIDNLDTLQEEREATLKELNQVMEEENERRKAEAEAQKNEVSVIEQISLGVTDPIEIFTSLMGEVPYDFIKSYTDTMKEEEMEPVKLGRYDRLVDPKTGKVITGQALGGVGGGTGEGTGAGWISDSDLEGMTTEERDFVNKVIRQLPTKLKDSEQEKKERMKEALFDYRRGRGIQEVVDEMNSYIIADEENRALGGVFRSLAVGSGVDLGEISAAMNTGNPTLAMTTIENAKLADAEGFFSGTDDARNVVSQANKVLSIMNGMSKETLDKMGAYDGREFKVKRFADMTSEEELKLQNLNTAMQLLNSPLRLALAGTAVTAEEFKRIEDFQTEITDQPDIAKTKVSQLRDSILNFHNQARSQRGLPTVDTNELIDDKARLRIYEDMAGTAEAVSYEQSSNSGLLLGTDETKEDVWGTIGL